MKNRILIIGNPQKHPSSEAFLQKFVNIMKDINKEVYIISGDKPPLFKNVYWTNIVTGVDKGFMIRILDFIKIQVQIMILTWKLRSKYDRAVILPTTYIIPNIFLNLIRKNVAIFVAQKPSLPSLILSNINFIFSDIIIIESENVIKDWGIYRYKNKIFQGSMYVDLIFSNKKSIFERKKIVGFIGRLSEEKGVLKFVEAIPNILKSDNQNLKFLIAGNGKLSLEIQNTLKVKNLNQSVRFIDWIPHNELPEYLNTLALIVLPSSTEGLPNILLEAMACGTPVLATSIGGIPDLIKDGNTGFIMRDNTPECITKNVIRALNHEKLDNIAINAEKIIKKKYRYEYVINKYYKILKLFGDLN